MRPVLCTPVTGPFEPPQPSTNWREPGASNRNTASLPIVAWASRLRLVFLPYTWLATAIWPSTMPPGRNGALIQLVLSNKQRDDGKTVVIDKPSSDIYNAKGQYRCISLQSKFVAWELSMTTPAATCQSNPPEQLLKEPFPYTTVFHPGQRDIIEQLVQGKRLLVIQRTSWGESLCYQVASLYYPHLTLVFSPLKALMRDQCHRFTNIYSIPSATV